MSDDFLDLFVADFSIKKEERNTIYKLGLRLNNSVSDVIVPNDMLKESTEKQIGKLLLERLLIDLTEGVTEAFNKQDPKFFPSYQEYMANI